MFESLIASVIVALLSLTGVFVLGRRGHLIGTRRFIIPIAIGVLLGVVFFELIPETLMTNSHGMLAIATGFLSFYLLSNLLRTFHHHHDSDCNGGTCESKAGASMLLIGDSIHNLTDGVVITTAFLINPAVGISTTIGIALHEIPQEIAEYGVLLKAGYTRGKAAFYNLLSASTIIIGVLLTMVFVGNFSEYLWILTGLAAGNLLYIAAADLIPNVHAESRADGRFFQAFIATLIGMVGIVLILEWSHAHFGHEDDHDQDVHIEQHTGL